MIAQCILLTRKQMNKPDMRVEHAARGIQTTIRDVYFLLQTTSRPTQLLISWLTDEIVDRMATVGRPPTETLGNKT